MVVERSLGLFKARFRKLRTTMDVNKVADIPEIVIAACVLHNICLLEDDIEDFLDDVDGDDDDDDDGEDIFPPAASGTDKRNMIMREL